MWPLANAVAMALRSRNLSRHALALLSQVISKNRNDWIEVKNLKGEVMDHAIHTEREMLYFSIQNCRQDRTGKVSEAAGAR